MYSQNLRLPGEFIKKTSENLEPGLIARELRGHVRQLRSAEVKRHGEIKPFYLQVSKNNRLHPPTPWPKTKFTSNAV